MASFDENSVFDSDQNQINSGYLNAEKERLNSPPRKSKKNSDNYSPNCPPARQSEGIILNLLKSILSFRKFNIIYKIIITDNLKPAIIKQLSMENIEIIASFLKSPKNSKEYNAINRLFANGGECYALIENSMLALTWVILNKYRISNGSKELNIRPDEALIAETVLAESVDNSKALLLEDGIALLLKQRGIKPMIFARRGDNDTPVYSIYQIRFLGFKFTFIRANPALSPLGFR
jgi:hypothetical protein